jgi:hypothetical protein
MAFFVFVKVAVGTTAGIASRDNSNLNFSLQCNQKLRVTVDVLGGFPGSVEIALVRFTRNIEVRMIVRRLDTVLLLYCRLALASICQSRAVQPLRIDTGSG